MRTITAHTRTSARMMSAILALILLFLCIWSVPAQAADFKTGKYQVDTAAGVNVRSKASTEGVIRGAVQNGIKFTVTKVSGEWGYTKSIKTTAGNKNGWVNLNYCKLISSSASSTTSNSKKSVITFSNMTDLGTHSVGLSQPINGTIKSSNKKITSVNAILFNRKKPEVNIYDITVKPNATSFKLGGSRIDDGLKIGNLPAGDYRIEYKVVTQDGVTATKADQFTLKKSTYNRKKALSYADKETTTSWGSDSCAYFASAVLRAGGLNFPKEGACSQLHKKLMSQKYASVEQIKLKATSDNHIKATSKIEPGDIIIQYVSGDTYPWSHAMVVASIDSSNRIRVYAQNSTQHNELTPYTWCGRSDTTCYAYHIK